MAHASKKRQSSCTSQTAPSKSDHHPPLNGTDETDLFRSRLQMIQERFQDCASSYLACNRGKRAGAKRQQQQRKELKKIAQLLGNMTLPDGTTSSIESEPHHSEVKCDCRNKVKVEADLDGKQSGKGCRSRKKTNKDLADAGFNKEETVSSNLKQLKGKNLLTKENRSEIKLDSKPNKSKSVVADKNQLISEYASEELPIPAPDFKKTGAKRKLPQSKPDPKPKSNKHINVTTNTIDKVIDDSIDKTLLIRPKALEEDSKRFVSGQNFKKTCTKSTKNNSDPKPVEHSEAAASAPTFQTDVKSAALLEPNLKANPKSKNYSIIGDPKQSIPDPDIKKSGTKSKLTPSQPCVKANSKYKCKNQFIVSIDKTPIRPSVGVSELFIPSPDLEGSNAKLVTANTKSESADAKSESADTKSESADTKSESTYTKSESADTKSESADTKSESADTKSESADTKSESADTKSESADTKSDSANTKSHSANTKSESTNAKSESADTQSESTNIKSDSDRIIQEAPPICPSTPSEGPKLSVPVLDYKKTGAIPKSTQVKLIPKADSKFKSKTRFTVSLDEKRICPSASIFDVKKIHENSESTPIKSDSKPNPSKSSFLDETRPICSSTFAKDAKSSTDALNYGKIWVTDIKNLVKIDLKPKVRFTDEIQLIDKSTSIKDPQVYISARDIKKIDAKNESTQLKSILKRNPQSESNFVDENLSMHSLTSTEDQNRATPPRDMKKNVAETQSIPLKSTPKANAKFSTLSIDKNQLCMCIPVEVTKHNNPAANLDKTKAKSQSTQTKSDPKSIPKKCSFTTGLDETQPNHRSPSAEDPKFLVPGKENSIEHKSARTKSDPNPNKPRDSINEDLLHHPSTSAEYPTQNLPKIDAEPNSTPIAQNIQCGKQKNIRHFTKRQKKEREQRICSHCCRCHPLDPREYDIGYMENFLERLEKYRKEYPEAFVSRPSNLVFPHLDEHLKTCTMEKYTDELKTNDQEVDLHESEFSDENFVDSSDDETLSCGDSEAGMDEEDDKTLEAQLRENNEDSPQEAATTSYCADSKASVGKLSEENAHANQSECYDYCPFCDDNNYSTLVLPDFCKINLTQTTCEMSKAEKYKMNQELYHLWAMARCSLHRSVDKVEKKKMCLANITGDKKKQKNVDVSEIKNEDTKENGVNKMISSLPPFADRLDIDLIHNGSNDNYFIKKSWLLPQPLYLEKMTDDEVEKRMKSLRKSPMHVEEWEESLCERVSQEFPQMKLKKEKLFPPSSWIDSHKCYKLCKPYF